VVVIFTGLVMLIDRARVVVPDPVSPTLTVKFDVPGVVGVPEICPVKLRLKPAGRDPAVISQA
jgi:hypothetical protein